MHTRIVYTKNFLFSFKCAAWYSRWCSLSWLLQKYHHRGDHEAPYDSGMGNNVWRLTDWSIIFVNSWKTYSQLMTVSAKNNYPPWWIYISKSSFKRGYFFSSQLHLTQPQAVSPETVERREVWWEGRRTTTSLSFLCLPSFSVSTISCHKRQLARKNAEIRGECGTGKLLATSPSSIFSPAFFSPVPTSQTARQAKVSSFVFIAGPQIR